MKLRPRTIAMGTVLGSALLLAVYPFWLTLLGRALVHSDAACRGDVAVVLAGDWTGRRLLKAAELASEGCVQKVLLDGPNVPSGVTESDVALKIAFDQGYPESMFIRFPNTARSTREEAGDVAEELHRLKVHRFVLVTSNYHTARARRIFRRRIPDIPFCTVAATDEDFSPSGWWKTRDGRRVWFVEWCKTVADWFGA